MTHLQDAPIIRENATQEMNNIVADINNSMIKNNLSTSELFSIFINLISYEIAREIKYANNLNNKKTSPDIRKEVAEEIFKFIKALIKLNIE